MRKFKVNEKKKIWISVFQAKQPPFFLTIPHDTQPQTPSSKTSPHDLSNHSHRIIFKFILKKKSNPPHQNDSTG